MKLFVEYNNIILAVKMLYCQETTICSLLVKSVLKILNSETHSSKLHLFVKSGYKTMLIWAINSMVV